MPKLRDATPSGPLASGLANLLTFILTPWGVVMATIIASGVAVWNWSRSLLFTPGFAVFGGVWIVLFWTWIGLRTLRAHASPRKVTVDWDCAYCLGVENNVFVFEAGNLERAFQLVLNLRNVGNGPIKLRVEQFQLRSGDRVSEEQPKNEIILPRLSPKGVISGALRRDAVPDAGLMKFALVAHYGRHDGNFTRRYSITGDINFRVDGNNFSGGLGIQTESDEDI